MPMAPACMTPAGADAPNSWIDRGSIQTGKERYSRSNVR